MNNYDRKLVKLRYKSTADSKQSKRSKRSKKKEIKSVEPIQLRPNQMDHKNALVEILKKSPFAMDFSMLGTGKTYTSSKIYQEGEYKNIVTIVPTSVKAKWRHMSEHHGIDQFASISYCELRSIKLKQPKHRFLVRRDYTTTMQRNDGTIIEIEQCEFTATNFYKNLVKEGLLLVIDEIQNVKNLNDQLLACKELIKVIVEDFKNGGKSRVLLLSGSPIDKRVQVIHLFRCLGIMRSDQLRTYNPFTGETVDRGIEEIREYLKANFADTYNSYLQNYYWDNFTLSYIGNKIKDLENQCYNYFQQIVKPELSSSMPPLAVKVDIIKRNAFYNMDKSSLNLLHTGIEMLERATNYNPIYGTVNHGNNGVESLTNIQRALVMIETSKIELLARITRDHLFKNARAKVVICVNYTATIEDLAEELSRYRPLILNGSVSSNKRYEILSKFQSPTSEHRLLIGNVTVCSTGIDLDDQDGSFPRLCLVNPNYSAISLYQLSHRFHRCETKSAATVHFVFGKSSQTELPILNALAKKGEVMRETTEKQAEFGIIFPGEYQSWEEK